MSAIELTREQLLEQLDTFKEGLHQAKFEYQVLRTELMAEQAKKKETTGLTFAALRVANILRLPQFKNRKGEPAHSSRDGSDWCLAQWANAVTGELGEAANLIKKIERGDMTLNETREDLARELADVQTYLDILAFRAGIDLGDATIGKWNDVSKRIGIDLRLSDEHSKPVVHYPLSQVECRP